MADQWSGKSVYTLHFSIVNSIQNEYHRPLGLLCPMNGRCCLFSARFKVFFFLFNDCIIDENLMHFLCCPIQVFFFLEQNWFSHCNFLATTINYQLVIHHTIDAGPDASALISLQDLFKLLFVHFHIWLWFILSISRAPYPIELHPSLNDRIRYFSIKKLVYMNEMTSDCMVQSVYLYIFCFFFLSSFRNQCTVIHFIHGWIHWIPWILNTDRRFSSCLNRNTTNDGINSNIGIDWVYGCSIYKHFKPLHFASSEFCYSST